ncbi:hypothetical protein CWC39_07625, partial [Corynebacterium heidelbergense]
PTHPTPRLSLERAANLLKDGYLFASRTRKAQMADMAYEDSHVAAFKGIVAEEVLTMVRAWSVANPAMPTNVYDTTSLAFGRAAF